MSTQNYKYVVVEDEHLIRKNIIKKISSLQLPFTLAGEASNGLDARDIIEKTCPNLVITDIHMPQFDGLELAHYLYKNHPHIKVVLASGEISHLLSGENDQSQADRNNQCISFSFL